MLRSCDASFGRQCDDDFTRYVREGGQMVGVRQGVIYGLSACDLLASRSVEEENNSAFVFRYLRFSKVYT